MNAPVLHPSAEAATPSAPPRLEAVYRRSNAAVEAEVDTTLTVAEGALPPGLEGVLFRNGPGKQEAHGVPYEHPFDGDGMVLRFEFHGGTVRYRNRFVRTREFEEEAAAGEMRYRAFGTNLPGGVLANVGRLRFKNAANTSLVQHAGMLLALWEGGLPHELAPTSLATLGRHDYDGALRPTSSMDRWIAPELPFSAHPTVDPATGELFNFGTAYGTTTRLLRYRVTRDGTCEVRPHRLSRMSFMHDFALTDRSEIYFLTPVTFDVPRTLLGLTTPVGSIVSDRQAPTRILVFPRGADGPPLEFEAPSCFIFHFVGAWETPDAIIVDTCRIDDMPSADDARRFMRGEPASFGTPELVRFTLDRRRGTVTEHRLSDVALELPRTHPGTFAQPHRHVWGITRRDDPDATLFTGIARVDVTTGTVVSRDFGSDLTGEPVFVPSGGHEGDNETDGWVLSLVYRNDHHRSDLFVLDAQDLSTVARLELPHHVPVGFHGIWLAA